MQPFLYQLASLFYKTYKAKVSRFAFVFPNRRAGIFFRKYLAEVSEKPLFSPSILTINDLFIKLSGKQPADRISMLFTLYSLYIQKSNSVETFDEFLYWGEMLLNDFDDVDKYMVEARMLFTNVIDPKQLEGDFSYLNEKQVAAIRSFWSSFFPHNDSPNKQSFRAVWEILNDLYHDLKQTLSLEQKGYEGMIFREVVEHLEKDDSIELPYTKIIFVGLNALSVVEERLLTELQKRGIADFYWDYSSDKVKDPDNKASYFIERNLKMYPSLLELPKELKPPTSNIEVIGIPSGIGQAKQVYTLLNEFFPEKEMTDDEALRTAIILPDEHLLIPVLHAIPEHIKKINVTMGYPLVGTPVASLIDYILALQKNIRYIDRLPRFYYRDVLPILNHPYIISTNKEVISTLIKDITNYNKIFIDAADLDKSTLLGFIFSPAETVDELSDYLIKVLEQLNKVLHAISINKEEEDKPARIHDIEQEFIFHYFTTVNRLKEVILNKQIVMKIDTYSRLLKRLTETITIPFQGEPLSGLQIMGVLETRALDFDRLIFLSMNEGIFPQKKVSNSFIPYNLRRGFGLPTYEHQDSISAYYFYRLLHRASHVSLIYDTRNNGLQTGEMSRFIHQLHYHYEEPIHNKLVVYNVSSSKNSTIIIEKTDAVMERLLIFHKGGAKAISASAINIYLDCPLKFYFSAVEGVEEEEEVDEMIGSNIFGSILHKVMEDLYQPLCGKIVTADLLKLIKKDKPLLTKSITQAFAEIFFKTEIIRPLTGQNYLIGEMIRKYVEKILDHDRKLTPFHYIESEKRIQSLITLSNNTSIQLKGFIDRIDEVKDTVRIIDYKSGAGTDTFNTLYSLFDIEDKDRPKAIMQVFMYAWMYSRLPEGTNKRIQPTIYYMRKLFDDSFKGVIYKRSDSRKKELVENFTDFSADFETDLRNCLDMIFDSTTPFIQTPNGKACTYCPFKNICGK